MPPQSGENLKAYAIVQHGAPLEMISRATPEPVGRQVLVAVTHGGVCHSDLSEWSGNRQGCADARRLSKPASGI
jgi:D-arabinose 1-dehydrogenase-like Zn-dependent alcohol dehydrogenase